MTYQPEQVTIRLRDGRYLVQACQEWIKHVNEAQSDDFLAKALGPFHPDEIAEIESLIRAIETAATDRERLLATEVLADHLYLMVVERRLPTRIPPIDAVEGFLYMGNPRPCVNHAVRYGAFKERNAYFCAHCLDAAGGLDP